MDELFQLCQQPTFLLNVAVAAGIAALWRKRVASRAQLLCVTIPFLLLNLACTRAAVVALQSTLTGSLQSLDSLPSDAQAVVVLAGYAHSTTDGYPRPELGDDTLCRCEVAAHLCRSSRQIPILTTGGPVDGDASQPAIASLMRDYFVRCGFDGDGIIVEPTSRSTYENAVETCRLLKERNIDRIVLVTDAAHMRRAVACFRKQGMHVTPAPARYHEVRWKFTVGDFLPNPRVAEDFEFIFHEWLGIAYYHLRDRI